METIEYPSFEALDFALSGLGPDYMTALSVLYGEGIRGFHSDCNSCPIAEYLYRHLPGQFQVFYYSIVWELAGETVYHQTSSSLRLLMKVFDDGKLPGLCCCRLSCKLCPKPKVA